MIYEKVLDSLASAPSGTLWKILVILFHLNHQTVLHPSTWPWDLKSTGWVQSLITYLLGFGGACPPLHLCPTRAKCPLSGALCADLDSTLRGPGLMWGSLSEGENVAWSIPAALTRYHWTGCS